MQGVELTLSFLFMFASPTTTVCRSAPMPRQMNERRPRHGPTPYLRHLYSIFSFCLLAFTLAHCLPQHATARFTPNAGFSNRSASPHGDMAALCHHMHISPPLSSVSFCPDDLDHGSLLSNSSSSSAPQQLPTPLLPPSSSSTKDEESRYGDGQDLPTVAASPFIFTHSSTSAELNNFSSSAASSTSDSSGSSSSSSPSASSPSAPSATSGDHNAVLLLPGFASTQLYNWRFKDCFPFSYNLADRFVLLLFSSTTVFSSTTIPEGRFNYFLLIG
jgi:hypothetical protein